jgi:CRP/FNR family transcriptional regulator
MRTDWLANFPALERLEAPVRQRLSAASTLVTLPAGATVFREGCRCDSYLLVLQGSVRVQKVSESGREIVLYRVESGQSCVLTTSCLLACERYSAEGVTETPVEAVALPQSLFQELVASSGGFRSFVFASYAERISGLLMLIDAIAFGRMDGRLAARLLELADRDGSVGLTHQAIAAELGTAREVISRLLKEFERKGLLSLGRGRIEILAPGALRLLVDQPAV